MRFALALLAMAMPAFGQLTGHSVIAGTVIESSNNEPVSKVILTLTLQGAPETTWASARTDSSGNFKFESLPAGKYALRGSKPGAGTAFYGADRALEAGQIITLSDNETLDGLKLHFIRSASLAGNVLDPSGFPVPQVEVIVSRVSRQLGERVLATYRRAGTNDRGEYRIADLEPGEYYSQAQPPDEMGIAPQSGNELLTGQYYGGAKQWKDSTPVAIRSGAALTGMDFHLVAEPVHSIHGRVTGVPPDHGDATVDVTISPDDDGVSQWSNGGGFVGPEFNFNFEGLTGGVYRLEAQLQTGGRLYSASQRVDTNQADGEIVLRLAQAHDIKGRLRIEGQADPVKAVEVRLARGRQDGAISARPGADGTFTLQQVRQGEWTLNMVPLPRGTFLKSASFGNKDVRFTRFTVEPDSEASLNIVVSTRVARVDGEIEGNSKRAGIVLAPTGSLHNLARFYYGAVADDEGKFHMDNIAPGKYKIFALENMAPPNFRNPEAADKLDRYGQEIELAEGATVSAHPRLIPVEQVREALPPDLRR